MDVRSAGGAPSVSHHRRSCDVRQDFARRPSAHRTQGYARTQTNTKVTKARAIIHNRGSWVRVFFPVKDILLDFYETFVVQHFVMCSKKDAKL
jgi:hypothetical protein